MLRVSDINENIDNISLLLSKRNIDVKDKLVEILKIDKSRRSIQSELDGVLAESNKLAKEIGDLFKNGQAGLILAGRFFKMEPSHEHS